MKVTVPPKSGYKHPLKKSPKPLDKQPNEERLNHNQGSTQQSNYPSKELIKNPLKNPPKKAPPKILESSRNENQSRFLPLQLCSEEENQETRIIATKDITSILKTPDRHQNNSNRPKKSSI